MRAKKDNNSFRKSLFTKGQKSVPDPKLFLGQNFLRSRQAVSAIIKAGEISETDTVLEIGPGRGVLTKELLEKCKVIAVEKDADLIPILEEKFGSHIKNSNLTLLNADILEMDASKLPKKYKIIANIPYYITGAIIRKFLESKNQPEKMVLLVQKEVADRIIARDGKESILSISVKAYGTPKYIQKVGAKSFSPAPKVDSAVISISNISKKNFKNIDESKFFEILRAGFAHKRKILSKNLESIAKKEQIADTFQNFELNHNTRAEELGVEGWMGIARSL